VPKVSGGGRSSPLPWWAAISIRYSGAICILSPCRFVTARSTLTQYQRSYPDTMALCEFGALGGHADPQATTSFIRLRFRILLLRCGRRMESSFFFLKPKMPIFSCSVSTRVGLQRRQHGLSVSFRTTQCAPNRLAIRSSD
jgi:hypothetical protein